MISQQFNAKKLKLNSQSNIIDQQPPNGIILPPPDTPLSIDSTIITEKSNIDGLAKVNLEPNFLNKFTTQSSFPTLISLKQNQNVIPIKINKQSISKINSNNLNDGETQIYQKNTNNNRKKNILKPPQLINSNGNIETLKILELQSSKEGEDEMEELTTQKAFKSNQMIDFNFIKNEEKSLEHIPPLPVNPETTWIPFNYNIQPSLLNTSKANRTTFSPYNNILKTTKIITNKNFQQNSELINNNNNNYKRLYTITTTYPTHSTPKKQISFLLKRRENLPILIENNPKNKFKNNYEKSNIFNFYNKINFKILFKINFNFIKQLKF